MTGPGFFVVDSALPQFEQAKLMLRAQRADGVSLGRQTLEMVRLQKSRAALTAYEYQYYRLHRPELSWDEKLAFMGEQRTRALYLLANQFTWWDAAEDKLAFHGAMQAQGYPTPRLHALAHPARTFGGVANLSTAAEIVDWLKTAPTPLFGKPVNSTHGVGGVLIADVDAKRETFRTCAGETYPLAALADAIQPFVASGGYLFQEALIADGDVGRMTDGRLATLRVIVLLGPDGPVAHHVICRLPSGANRVDNFRRPGNLICAVDPQTGALGPVIRGVGLDREVLDAHPDTNAPFVGARLPQTAEAVALALRASTGFPGLHMQSWDIALCAGGARVIEMNPGGNLNLVQLSNDRGAWTPELQAFAQWCRGLEINTQVRGRELAVKLAA